MKELFKTTTLSLQIKVGVLTIASLEKNGSRYLLNLITMMIANAIDALVSFRQKSNSYF